MQCPNGHEITPNEAFCTTCGAKAQSASGFSSLKPAVDTPVHSGTPQPSADASSVINPKKKSVNAKLLISIIGGVAALIVVLAVAFGNSTVKLTVVTTQYHSTCSELDSSNSVFNGAEVTVKGPNHKVVGSGAYGEGSDGHEKDSHNNRVATCTFTTTITVPNDLASYKVIVDSPPGISFQLDDLKKNGWEADISVGYNYTPPSDTSYSDGYNWGYDNAYSSSDCDWWSNGPSYDNQYQWESGCRAGYYANPY